MTNRRVNFVDNRNTETDVLPRVAFVTSHPIQYQVPVFRHLAQRSDLDFEVLFAMLPDAAAQGAGFGVEFEWDIPLLEGYDYTVLDNVSRKPGLTHFSGCDTPSILSVLKEHRIDVVVVNGWVVKTCLQALRACRRLGIPCLVRCEANNLRPRPWWKRILQRQLVRRYDRYLPIGSANRAFYRSHGVADHLMNDALYCVENRRFAKAADLAIQRRRELRERWGIADDALCFLFCGKFETKKHPLELVAAFGKAVAQGANCHLLMVGDGQLRQQCEEFAKERSLPITFTGFLNQTGIVDAYVAADVLVLPSDHGETWGLVVNEAMACGKPAIVSDQAGCVLDLIEQEQTGWEFPFGDWDALAALMATLAGKLSEQALAVLGQHCRDRVNAYSPEAAADGVARAVQAVWSTRNLNQEKQSPARQR